MDNGPGEVLPTSTMAMVTTTLVEKSAIHKRGLPSFTHGPPRDPGFGGAMYGVLNDSDRVPKFNA